MWTPRSALVRLLVASLFVASALPAIDQPGAATARPDEDDIAAGDAVPTFDDESPLASSRPNAAGVTRPRTRAVDGPGGSITTVAPNNGSGGIFLDLTPAAGALTFDAFDTYISSTAGTAVQIEVWTRPGTYVGNTGSSTGWTLAETASGTSAGSTNPAPFTLATPIPLPAGGTTAIYLHSITAGGGIRYTGTSGAPPQTTYSNADITLFSDVSRTGAVPFGGTQFTPRTFAGTAYYSIVPGAEPDIAVDPTDLSSTQEVDTQVVVQLDITNNGDADLDWTIEEAAALSERTSFRSLPRRRSGPFHPYRQTVHDETPAAVGAATESFSRARGQQTGLRVVPQRPDAPVGSVTITHSATQTITSLNSVSCNAGGFHTDNAYLRRFTLGDFGITSDFDVQQVEVGVEIATGTGGTQPVTVNLYTWNPADPFTYANFTEIGTIDTTVADTTATVVAIPVTGTAPAGSTLVVELFTPSGQPSTASFFIGSNADGQTGPGFIAAADCGITEPTDLGAIGFPNMHMVMNVTGIAGGCGDDLTWVSTSPTAGTTVPLATSTVDVTFDSTGLDLGQILLGSLCINSNDPDSPTVLVPLTLEVDTMPFLDGFESGDTSEWSATQP